MFGCPRYNNNLRCDDVIFRSDPVVKLESPSTVQRVWRTKQGCSIDIECLIRKQSESKQSSRVLKVLSRKENRQKKTKCSPPSFAKCRLLARPLVWPRVSGTSLQLYLISSSDGSRRAAKWTPWPRDSRIRRRLELRRRPLISSTKELR